MDGPASTAASIVIASPGPASIDVELSSPALVSGCGVETSSGAVVVASEGAEESSSPPVVVVVPGGMSKSDGAAPPQAIAATGSVTMAASEKAAKERKGTCLLYLVLFPPRGTDCRGRDAENRRQWATCCR